MKLILLLLLLCSTWEVSFAMSIHIQFMAVKLRSNSTPFAMETLPGRDSMNCATLCALRPTCFGFSWLQGLCRLFDWLAFSSTDGWQASESCDVYTRIVDSQPQTQLKLESCSQSSTHGSNVCGRAIDGNRNQDYYGDSCAHTENNPFEWWEGQLAAPSFVSYVTIYNRQDCCTNWLKIFSLQVDGVECNRVNLTVPFSVANFSCNAFGRQVRVTNLRT
uniref:F5/8 type C domain-containing protein n=1 Tax=Macrostomum lignano TaxID=282301 RepID=A0A1I8GNT3_9PLAT